MLRGIDALVIDLQDIGARIYTYIYTMANCLRAAARHGVQVIVCDRPNPIGGTDVEGACLEPACESFVGQFPIPMRHGMTIGELAALFNDAFWDWRAAGGGAMEGWRREHVRRCHRSAVGHAFAQHPHARHGDRLPGSVLFEGTMLSEGRGTTRPVRAGRSALDRGRAFCGGDERSRPAGRLFPAGGLRADVSEARQTAMRRLPDPRDRSR
jgi:uncharacterized protein YbbC (DUF1343 family)